MLAFFVFFFKQKTAYEMRISDWSSDVCSSDLVEGNLLAAAQEVEKLKLLAEGGQVTAETVQAAVADSARYDVFGLIDAALLGQPEHILRMLTGLRGEGVEAPVILWAVAREVRQLANIAQQYSQGVPLDRPFRSEE